MSVRRVDIRGCSRWQVRVSYQGRRISRLAPSRQRGIEIEAELVQRLREDAARAEYEGAGAATVRQLAELYLADLEARGKGKDTIVRARTAVNALGVLLPEILDRPVVQVKPMEMIAFRQGRLRSGALPGTVNRDLRVFRAMLRRAMPGFRFPRDVFLPEDETRVRWLAPEEEIVLLGGMRSPFQEMSRLAALTLMRQSEIRTLRRPQVRLEQGVVILPRAKGGSRQVVLSYEAQQILVKQLASHQWEYVFANPATGRPYSRVHVGRVFREAARAVGLVDFRFHDLRHHGATVALNSGFTAPTVMALGGWKTERMMRRYAAVTDKTLRAAAEAVSGAGRLPETRERLQK